MDRLAAMRSFLRVVDMGGFRAAADGATSKAMVSKQVRFLESVLGVALLTRNTRRLSLTEAGHLYRRHCIRILDDIASAEVELGAYQERPQGLLRINAPMSFGLLHVAPLMPAFMARYPDIRLDLDLQDIASDLVGEGYDITLCIRKALADSTLFARRLTRIGHVLCAAPSLLEKAGRPSALHDLRGFPRLAYSLSGHGGDWHLPTAGEDAVVVDHPPVFKANNSLAIREALLAGLGVALVPAFVVADDMAAGRLVRLLPDWEMPAYNLYAVFPSQAPHGSRLIPKVRVFIDFLAEVMPKSIAL